MFRDFVIFSSIIIVHESGHLLGALIYHWHIDKIILLPFGGITIFKENINKPLKEEFIITILGPLFQIIFYLLFGNLNPLFTQYNILILVFNLLPIVPLDGSKILSIICHKFFSFIMSSRLVILSSSVFLTLLFCLLVFKNYNLLFVIILIFIAIEIIKEGSKLKYYFNRFLLERYLYDFNFKKTKKVYRISQMQKEKRHLFYQNGQYHTEREILHKMFDKTRYMC